MMETVTDDLAARERNLNSLSAITLIVTLTAVSMTFGALIVVFMMRAMREDYWQHIKLPGILWFSTLLLLTSSVLFERARKKLVAGHQEEFHRLISWTMGAGLLFLLSQIMAGVQIVNSGIVLANNPHPWFILIFCGLHGLHILAGLTGFAVLWWRTRERASGPRYQMGTRAGARSVGVFWHYMDAMWILLFALLLFWRR
jgi:cytochrome c oxidase subunit 3